jgi:hypothetical protein
MNASNAEKVRLLRQGTGIGLREAYDLIVRCNGDLEAAKAKVAARSDRGVYISPEQECRAAIEEYYAALDRRADGVVAMSKAFRKIENALGMSWKQGASFEYMPEPGHIAKWNRGPNYDVIYLKVLSVGSFAVKAIGSMGTEVTPMIWELEHVPGAIGLTASGVPTSVAEDWVVKASAVRRMPFHLFQRKYLTNRIIWALSGWKIDTFSKFMQLTEDEVMKWPNIGAGSWSYIQEAQAIFRGGIVVNDKEGCLQANDICLWTGGPAARLRVRIEHVDHNQEVITVGTSSGILHEVPYSDEKLALIAGAVGFNPDGTLIFKEEITNGNHSSAVQEGKEAQADGG